ncbi:MAG: FAD-binding oxidoreductase [Alphaproteobacteria bacterium]|nr:FAD-binding oxidoreductase [Alphaproteobacteria bacterium]
MGPNKPRVIVVGAGIVGASIAYHLTRNGAAVTLMDQGDPGYGVTQHAFAWLTLSQGANDAYRRLRHDSLLDCRRLNGELGDILPVSWTGSITWGERTDESEQFVRDSAQAGYDVRLVERAEIQRLEPGLKNPPSVAAYAAQEGAVDPVVMTQILVRAAKDAGARVLTSHPVTGLVTSDAKITGVRYAETMLEADCVVLAAGVSTQNLLASIGVAVPIESSPSILARFTSQTALMRRILCGPEFEARQTSETEIIAAEEYIAADGADSPENIALRTLDAIRTGLQGGESVTLKSVNVGWRPIPKDGFPVVGFTAPGSGLYVAVTHAGIMLSPVIGRLAATEICDGITVDLLREFRPDRFA